MERQTEIYEEAQVKKRTWRARNELVSKADLRPTLKAVLKALWKFIGENEFCWPKQATLGLECGYGPKSVRALQKKLYQLRDLGIVNIENGVFNGSRRASKYCINWGILALSCEDPPPIPEAPVADHLTVPLSRPNGRDLIRPNERITIRPNGRIYTTSRNYQRNANNEQSMQSFGDGGLEKTSGNTQSANQPSGHWAGFVDDAFPDEERRRLFQAAITAGYLADCPTDRVRLLALVLQAKTRPADKITGFFIARVQRGDWGYLDPRHVKAAVERLAAKGLTLTPDELREVRMPRKAVPC